MKTKENKKQETKVIFEDCTPQRLEEISRRLFETKIELIKNDRTFCHFAENLAEKIRLYH